MIHEQNSLHYEKITKIELLLLQEVYVSRYLERASKRDNIQQKAIQKIMSQYCVTLVFYYREDVM